MYISVLNYGFQNYSLISAISHACIPGYSARLPCVERGLWTRLHRPMDTLLSGTQILYSPGSLGLMHEYSTDVGLTSITLFSFCISRDFKLLPVFMCYQKEERWIRALHLFPSNSVRSSPKRVNFNIEFCDNSNMISDERELKIVQACPSDVLHRP